MASAHALRGSLHVCFVFIVLLQPAHAQRKNSPFQWLTHVVQKAETLWSIAGSVWSEPQKWPDLYRSNIKVVQNPNLIYPDQKLRVRTNRTIEWRTYTVLPGESFWTIAKKQYTESSEYLSLLEANPNIKNPDRIFPGQLIRVPWAAVICETTWQAKVAKQALLYADVPAGSTQLAVEYWIRYEAPGSPWAKCEPGSGAEQCQRVALPALVPYAADPFGTMRYRSIVGAVGPDDGKYKSSSTMEARLVTRYTMIGSSCVSQATFEMERGTRHEAFLYVPSAISGFMDHYRDPSGAGAWQSCDINVSGTFNQKDGCRTPNGTGAYFGHADLRDATDGKVGKLFICHAGDPDPQLKSYPVAIYSCRTQVAYTP